MWYHHCILQPCSTAEQVDMHAIANVVRKCMYLQTHLISPLMHAGIGPLLASAVRTFCRTVRVHSHPTLTKRGQTQRMPSEQLQRLCRWSLWWAQASMPCPMAHSIAHPPGASVDCGQAWSFWYRLGVTWHLNSFLSNPFQEVWCQAIVCTCLR